MPQLLSPESIVFVVDDDPSVREAIVSLIRSAGLRAAAFSSAEEVLSAEGTEFSACLVVDVHLALMGGFELQRRLVALGWDIPVIFIASVEFRVGDLSSVRA